MPVFNKPNPTPVTPREEKIDTTTQYNQPSRDKVISTIDGTAWTCDFYAQFLKEDDIPRPLDLLLSPSHQQYLKIVNLNLMLTGELSYSEDASTGDQTVTGSALVWPGIKVNQYDHFIAEIDNHTSAIFIVTNVENLSYRNNTVRSIEFELFTLTTTALKDNLELKTIEVWYFNPETNTVGKTPIESGVSKDGFAGSLAGLYFDKFYNRDTQTFLVPREDNLYLYDFFMTQFFMNILNGEDRRHFPMVTLYDWGNGEYAREVKTILDLLLHLDGSLLRFVSKEFREVYAKEFTSKRVYLSAKNSKIDKLLWPKDKKTLNLPKVDLSEEGYYVFSKAFYKEEVEDMNALEKMVHKLLTKQVYPKWKELLDVINHGLDHDDEATLYYTIPVYYLLVQYAR